MHSFCMLASVFVCTALCIALVCISGIFVANVLLIKLALRAEHMPLHQDSMSAPYVTNLGVVGMYTRALQTGRHAIWLPVSAACAHTWPWACSTSEDEPPARSGCCCEGASIPCCRAVRLGQQF